MFFQFEIVNKKDSEEKKEEIKKEKEEKKENREIKKETKSIKISDNISMIELLENKMNNLGRQLNEEHDINKCENIISLMNKILDLLERYKKIH